MSYATSITALEEAMAEGALTVTINGKTVTYRSIEDLRSALEYFRGMIAAGDSGGGGALGMIQVGRFTG